MIQYDNTILLSDSNICLAGDTVTTLRRLFRSLFAPLIFVLGGWVLMCEWLREEWRSK